MDERSLQDAVIDLAHLLRWKCAHFRSVRVQHNDGRVTYQTPVQADGAGFPDLVLVRDRVLYVELKGERGRLSIEQQGWLHALKGAGVKVYVWYPRDWTDGIIEMVLR